MSDVFLRVVTTISGLVLAAVWGIVLLVWLNTSPPKAHPVWLAVIALGYALIAIPLYMGHGILILLAGQILVFFSAQALNKARQRYKDSNVHTEHIQHNR